MFVALKHLSIAPDNRFEHIEKEIEGSYRKPVTIANSEFYMFNTNI